MFGETAHGDLAELFEPEKFSEADSDQADHVEVCDLTGILANDETDDEGIHDLPKHWRCAAHTLNLVATCDAEKAISDHNYKKANRCAFAKAVSLWNKQSRCTLI